jgi:hypothetical protein
MVLTTKTRIILFLDINVILSALWPQDWIGHYLKSFFDDKAPRLFGKVNTFWQKQNSFAREVNVINDNSGIKRYPSSFPDNWRVERARTRFPDL